MKFPVFGINVTRWRMELTVKRHTKQITGPKKATRRDTALTIDQRSTEPNFDTSHITDTEQGITAPNTKTTVDSVRIQFRNRAENWDESNISGGNANSPERMDHMESENIKMNGNFAWNSVDKHVENIIMTLQNTRVIGHLIIENTHDCVPSITHSTICTSPHTSKPWQTVSNHQTRALHESWTVANQ